MESYSVIILSFDLIFMVFSAMLPSYKEDLMSWLSLFSMNIRTCNLGT